MTESTYPLRRSTSEETLVSTVSDPSMIYPGAPVNSPQTQSIAGDVTMALANLDRKLSGVPGGPTPPESEADVGEAGKPHLRAPLKENVSLLKQLFKRPPKLPKRKVKVTRKRLDPTQPATLTPRKNNGGSPGERDYNHVHENNTWVKIAVEDVERGLHRLTQAAMDENKIDSTKTVEQFYGEILGEILKQADVKLDPKYLL